MVLSRELAKICYASLLLVTSAICNAADSSQFYAGGNLAYSKARYENSQLVSDLASGGITATGTVDNTATGGKIFAGYKLVDLFAIEVGYFDLGTVLTDTGSYSRPTPASTFSGSTKIRGESIDLVWTIPVGKGFSALARLGGAFIRTDPVWNAASSKFSALMNNVRSNDLVGEAGLGAQYDINQRFSARAEYQRYFNVPTGLTSTTVAVDSFSIGMIVKF